MTPQDACCTCASVLSSQSDHLDSLQPDYLDEKLAQHELSLGGNIQRKTRHDKPLQRDHQDITTARRLPCCQRLVCHQCLTNTPRFHSYCPYCQISASGASSIPHGGLREPPTYQSPPQSPHTRPADYEGRAEEPRENDSGQEQPPGYDETVQEPPAGQFAPVQAAANPDISLIELTHHLTVSETVASVSLAYRISPQAIRRHNALYSDSLLPARRTLSIPLKYSCLPPSTFQDSRTGDLKSLSPQPVENKEEREWKAAVRRFMVKAKCADYELAECYLRQARALRNAEKSNDPEQEGIDQSKDKLVQEALEMWIADNEWELAHPFDSSPKSKLNANVRNLSGSGSGRIPGSLRFSLASRAG